MRDAGCKLRRTLPEGLDPADAVAAVTNGVTAWQMLHRAAKVRPEQTVLVHGASGGVGTLLVQLARLAGAEFDVVVTEVESGGPSDEAGAAPEDVVTAIGSVPVEDSGDLLGALRDYSPGENAQLTLTRGGEELTVDVPLGERDG